MTTKTGVRGRVFGQRLLMSVSAVALALEELVSLPPVGEELGDLRLTLAPGPLPESREPRFVRFALPRSSSNVIIPPRPWPNRHKFRPMRSRSAMPEALSSQPNLIIPIS